MTDPVNAVKSIYSVALLIFSLIVICALMFDEQTSLSQDVHPVLAFFIFWAALLWLSMVEGGQASMVGLPPIDRSLYKESHPISHAICEWGHRGDNLDRYLMGRQFMVLALVFVINMSGAPVADATVLGLPEIVTNIFLKSGLAMILTTCMIGQLNTQVNASHCMLDYNNTHFMTFTLYVAMGIEASGLLHASYLIQIIVAKMAGKPIESNEPPRDGLTSFIFWTKVLVSTALLIFALIVTFIALFDGKTTMWEGIPYVISMIVTIALWCVVGMLEGMQIAFFAVSKITEEERNTSVWAKKTCDLLFANGGRGLPGFMIGRQLCVVSCFFVAARATSMDIEDGESNVLGVPDGVQKFFDTGLLGAFITTIIASIAWQLVASAFPLAFLSTPITYILLRICLALEATGICNGAWVIAAVHKKAVAFQKDEVYVGTAEERANMGKADSVVQSLVGHLSGSAFPAGHELPTQEYEADYSSQRAKIVANIKDLRKLIDEASTADEKAVYESSLNHELSSLKKINGEQGELASRRATAVKDIEEGTDGENSEHE
uniref:Silicon transporter n=1 Tax=Amphora coffeiformis TaxID=265554 RepID=A0A7S3P3H9_9STRA